MQSVIIPVYNSSEWLADTLNSILKQSFNGKWEVSICDDSSTVKKESERERAKLLSYHNRMIR